MPAARRLALEWALPPAGALALDIALGLALDLAMLTGRHPLINDLSTDRADPPRYLVAPPQRPAYDADALRGPTERAYGDLVNLETPHPPGTVLAAVEALVAERGWAVAAREQAAPPGIAPRPWRLQAVAVTRLLCFKDDVLVEVRPRPRPEGGSTVAMRSKSRLGKGDLGANAKRIRAFLTDLRARLVA